MRCLIRVNIKLIWFVIYVKQPLWNTVRLNQLTMLITQYYSETLSNCILEHWWPYFRSLDRGYTDDDPKWWSVHVDEARFMHIFVRSDVTTFAMLLTIDVTVCPIGLKDCKSISQSLRRVIRNRTFVEEKLTTLRKSTMCSDKSWS